MRNVTITLDEETALWARVEAARRDTSVSRLVGDMLRDLMRTEQRYESALTSYLARPPARLKRSGRYPTREAIHARDRVR